MGGQRRVGLVKARESAGYTQERFAEAAGVSRETVVRWEGGSNAPSLYLRAKLARLLGRTQREFAELIDPLPFDDQVTAPPIGSDIDVACDWLDAHSGWRLGTARERLITRLRSPELAKARSRDAKRGTVARSAIVASLGDYYGDITRWCRAECGDEQVPLAIMSQEDWLDLGCSLSHETDTFMLAGRESEDTMWLDSVAANQAVRRLVEAVALDVAIVNSPLYRLKGFGVDRGRLAGQVSTVPFVQYALTSDLLETELVDHLAEVRVGAAGAHLPMRDRYLPTTSSVLDLIGRSCSGGVLALCAFARPADRSRGPADYVLLSQERGRRVLNGVGRLSVIPRGFHQPLTDFRADASIGATLLRELEEELFRRDDVDNTVSDGRIADPMHPNRLSEPMRWLLAEPDRLRLECTGFGLNLLNGNFEFACLAVIDDPEFWTLYGDRIEANWESVGLRQYSTRDPLGVRDLILDEAWSSEGLFALVQGIMRLNKLGDDRVALPSVDIGLG
jgi:DNA-binding XRE family transcriptional regulator